MISVRNLSLLLEKISRSLNKDKFIKDAIISTISDSIKIQISEDKISLKEGVLGINTTPIIKNELILKEDLIKSTLKNNHNINIVRFLYK